MAHPGGCTSSVGSLLGGLGVSGHFSDLSLVLQVGHVVFVEVRLGDDGFLIKQAFCECMVFTLNSLRFTLSYAQVQATRLIDARL